MSIPLPASPSTDHITCGVKNMGLGGLSIAKLLIVLAILVLLFGTKRLKGLGADIGDTIRGFRTSMGDDKPGPEAPGDSIDVQARMLEDSARKE
jgi:sec-independent protein translocase protein TatA